MIGVPLAEVVDGYMRKLGNDNPRGFSYFMSYAKSGLDIFHRQVNGTLKAVRADINSANGTVSLPSGCVKVARVFAESTSGGVSQLSESNNIHMVDDSCGNPVAANGDWGIGYSYDESGDRHTRDGYNVGAYYGLGGFSAAGQYRVNQAMGRLELSSVISSRSIIIEYIGMPEMVDGDYVVHPYLIEALEEYIHSASMKFKRGVSLSERDYWENKWVFSMLQGKVDIYGMTEKQIEYAAAKNTTLTPKI